MRERIPMFFYTLFDIWAGCVDNLLLKKHLTILYQFAEEQHTHPNLHLPQFTPTPIHTHPNLSVNYPSSLSLRKIYAIIYFLNR